MKKPFSLQPVLDLAQQRSDDAAMALGRLRGEEQKTRQTLETLKGYRDEYRARLEQALKNGITPGELNNYQAFLSKLDRAVEEQGALVRQSESRSASGLQNYQIQKRKLKSFDVLASREQETQRRDMLRQEQRALDEHSSSRTIKHTS